jgi:hypothetical protein
MDFWPGKQRPHGWSILWHKWNKGLSISYVVPSPKTETRYYQQEDGWYHPKEETVSDNSFWTRFFKHQDFQLTIAKLYGKWRISRASCPFWEAMINNTPLLSPEEWAALNEPIEIFEKDHVFE